MNLARKGELSGLAAWIPFQEASGKPNIAKIQLGLRLEFVAGSAGESCTSLHRPPPPPATTSMTRFEFLQSLQSVKATVTA